MSTQKRFVLIVAPDPEDPSDGYTTYLSVGESDVQVIATQQMFDVENIVGVLTIEECEELLNDVTFPKRVVHAFWGYSSESKKFIVLDNDAELDVDEVKEKLQNANALPQDVKHVLCFLELAELLTDLQLTVDAALDPHA